MFAEIIDKYLADIATVMEAADLKDHTGTLAKCGVVLQYIADHLELSKILLNNNADDSFAYRLLSLPKIEDMLTEALSEVSDAKVKEATITFAIHGSYKLLQEWLNDPHRSAAETEAALILELAGRVCAHNI